MSVRPSVCVCVCVCKEDNAGLMKFQDRQITLCMCQGQNG